MARLEHKAWLVSLLNNMLLPSLVLTSALAANVFNASSGFAAVGVGDDHGCMDGQTDYRWCPCHHRCEKDWDLPENACCTGSVVNSSCSWTDTQSTDTTYDLSWFAGRTFEVTSAYTGDADAAGYVYTFGICTEINPPSPDCDSQTALPPSTAYQTCKANNPSCPGAGTPNPTCNSLGVIDNTENKLTDPTDPAGGITVSYSGGTPCMLPDGATVPRSFIVAFTCNDDYTNIPDSEPVVEPAACTYQVNVKSAYACPARCVMGQNGKQCSGQGVCGYDAKLGSFCQCFGGYEGDDCSTPISGVDLAHYCGPGTTWTSYKPDCGPCTDDDCEASLGCCILGYTPTPVPQPTPAPGACEWLVPATSGFKGVSYDLSQLPAGVLSNGQAGYNVSNGVINGSLPDYDYVFGVCADVGIPDTLGCTSQTAIPSKAAAYQIGDWANQALWDDHCVQIGDIAQSAYKLLDPTNPVLGVEVTFAGGSSVGCPYARQLSLSFVCDPDYKGIEAIQTIDEPAVCQYVIEVKTAYGCPAQCKRGANGMLCSGLGTCGYDKDLEQAMCICDEGKTGADCSQDKKCAASKACAGTAAGSVLGTMACIGLAGAFFVKRGGRMPAMPSFGSGGTGMKSLRAPALEQTSGAPPVDMAAEYSQL